jgi:hypothetical protein
MNPSVSGFKDCAHQAAEICQINNGRLIRQFGLADFLENKLVATDRAQEIALKALEYFCDQRNPHDEKFRFGILAVGIFLDGYHAATPCDRVEDLSQPLRDLVTILTGGFNELQLCQWIHSHFPP